MCVLQFTVHGKSYCPHLRVLLNLRMYLSLQPLLQAGFFSWSLMLMLDLRLIKKGCLALEVADVLSLNKAREV